MQKCLGILVGLLLSFPAWADINVEPLLNKVTLQLNADQWVTTKTALVTIGVNVSVSDNDLGKTQSTIMDKLNQLASKAEWHIISFDRSQDQSGLEKIQVSATARLPEPELAGLRDKAKAISKPGETFTLDNVQFTPSDEELRDANTALRNRIYSQAKAEVDQLNKQYSDQKYYVHQINFIGDVVVEPLAQNKVMMASVPSANANFSVGDKLRISATVVLTSAPNQDVVKMVHN